MHGDCYNNLQRQSMNISSYNITLALNLTIYYASTIYFQRNVCIYVGN